MRELAESEKQEIASCIAAGISLPDKYRFLLFENRRGCELVWEGKTDRVYSPNQQLRCNQRLGAPPLAAWPGYKDMEQCGCVVGAWANKLIWGDNRQILAALLHGKLREEIEAQGGVKLIYIDPPFCTEADFSMAFKLGRPGLAAHNPASVAYRDKWGNPAAFLNMMYERLKLMHELLSPAGSIYVHCDWRMNSCLRLMLDEIFGNYVNEICWHYTGGGRSAKYFSRKHDSILVYSKSTQFIFNKDEIRIPYKQSSSYAKSGIRARSGKRYLPNPAGAIPDDVWDIPIINPLADERLGYPTQKPERLMERIIRASSRPGDLIADFFCGSGTFPAVAAKLGRKWLAADLGRLAIHTTRKRLLAVMRTPENLPDGAGFELWSLADNVAFSGAADSGGVVSGQAHIEARPCIQGHNVALQLLAFRAANQQTTGEVSHAWSDLIDYWAVDVDYVPAPTPENRSGGKVFNSWWRTWRQKGSLKLISPYWKLEPGLRHLAIEVVDIFGYSSIAVFAVNLPA